MATKSKSQAEDQVQTVSEPANVEPDDTVKVSTAAAEALATFKRTGLMPSGFVYDSRWPELIRTEAKAKSE